MTVLPQEVDFEEWREERIYDILQAIDNDDFDNECPACWGCGHFEDGQECDTCEGRGDIDVDFYSSQGLKDIFCTEDIFHDELEKTLLKLAIYTGIDYHDILFCYGLKSKHWR